MIDLHCVLCSFGVPLNGPLWMFGNNEFVIMSSAIPHSTLGKCWNKLSHHCVREAVAGGWLRFEHILGTENPANILTKPSPQFTLKIFIEPLLSWKKDTVNAPLGTTNPERRNVGPGLTVPDELSNHKQDSAHVNGHDGICVLATLCGNQCAVLFPVMPTDNKF